MLHTNSVDATFKSSIVVVEGEVVPKSNWRSCTRWRSINHIIVSLLIKSRSRRVIGLILANSWYGVVYYSSILIASLHYYWWIYVLLERWKSFIRRESRCLSRWCWSISIRLIWCFLGSRYISICLCQNCSSLSCLDWGNDSIQVRLSSGDRTRYSTHVSLLGETIIPVCWHNSWTQRDWEECSPGLRNCSDWNGGSSRI